LNKKKDFFTNGIGRRFAHGGSLRASVLGANDGLVSNFSIVMGFAGGTTSAGSPEFILLAGISGLLAGALSMGAGEYISMRSQRDQYEHQINRKRMDLLNNPEVEKQRLIHLYKVKGLSQLESETIATQIISNPTVALDTLVKEELGISIEQLGAPWSASISSLVAFSAGAIIPILPFFFGMGIVAIACSTFLSSVALLAVGGLLALISGKGPIWGSVRMFLTGLFAATVTYTIGYSIGIYVN